MVLTAIDAIAATMLVWAAVSDARTYTVPDSASLVLAALWVAKGVVALAGPGLAGMVWDLPAALAVFAAGYGLWLGGMMGGGDVKILSAAALYVGACDAPGLLVLTALFGGAVAGLCLAWHHRGAALAVFGGSATPRAGNLVIPYCLAITPAALLTLASVRGAV